MREFPIVGNLEITFSLRKDLSYGQRDKDFFVQQSRFPSIDGKNIPNCVVCKRQADADEYVQTIFDYLLDRCVDLNGFFTNDFGPLMADL